MDNTIKQRPVYAQFARGVAQTGLFLANEVREVAENDPALALRLSVGPLVSPILDGYSPQANAVTNQWLAPIVRVGLLAVNAQRALATVRNESASRTEKSLDVLCAAADAVGALGAWGTLLFPAHAALGAYAVGAANAVDIMTHSVRGWGHVGRRTKAWSAALAGDGVDNKPDSQPAAPKMPTPAASNKAPSSWSVAGKASLGWTGALPGATAAVTFHPAR